MEKADVPPPGAMTIDVAPARRHGAMVTDATLKVGMVIALADQTVRHRDAMTIDVAPTARRHEAIVTDVALKVGMVTALAVQTVRHRDVMTIDAVRLTNATIMVAEAPAGLRT